MTESDLHLLEDQAIESKIVSRAIRSAWSRLRACVKTPGRSGTSTAQQAPER